MPDQRKKKRTITVGLADLKKQTISVSLSELEAVAPSKVPGEERTLGGQFWKLSGIEQIVQGLKLARKNPAEAVKQLAQIPPALTEHLAEYVKDISGHPLGPGMGAARRLTRELPPPPGERLPTAQQVGQALDVGLPLPMGFEEVGRDITAERYGAAVGGALGLGTMALPGLAKKLPIPRRAKLGRTAVTIEGVRIPQALGEASRSVFWNKIRGLLQGSLVGKPLQALSQAQQRLANFTLKRIANRITLGAERGWWKHEKPAGAFHGGAEALRDKARPIYKNIDDITSELLPGAPERIKVLTGQARVRFMRYQGKVKAVAQRMTELLSDLDISEMLTLDPNIASTLRTRLASLQTAERLTVPFETFKSTRSALMSLRRKASDAGKHNAARLLSEAIDAVNDSAGDMLKAIDAQRGTTLAKDWLKANDMWKRAALGDDLSELFRKLTEGSRPSIQREMGMKPLTPTVRGKALIEEIELLQKDIEKVYGVQAYKNIEKIGEVLATGQRASPANMAGHFMTLSVVIIGLTLPATFGGAAIAGAYGAVTMTGAALASELVIGRVLAAAIASKNGRAAVLTMLRTKAGSAAASLAAIKVVSLANQNTERNMEGGLPAPPLPQAIEVGPADLRQNTEIMLRAKEGEITPAEANRQIPRRQRAIKLLRPPPQE